MYIETVPNRKSRPAILLREGKRVGKKIVKKTLANLTDWPEELVDSMRRSLRGETLVPLRNSFRSGVLFRMVVWKLL